MTLPLVDSWNVRGIVGEKYTVGPRCSHPECERWADHAHHMVRRSQLKGDFNWVDIDGVIFPNLCALCAEHHDEITGRVGGHKAAIRLIDGVFWWAALTLKSNNQVIYLPSAPLDPQPLSPEQAQRASSHATDSEHCPFCGHNTRRRHVTATPNGERRRRKSWTVKVPDDAENGADILDTLIDDAALLMGIDATATGRYYVLVPALYYMHQNWSEFALSLKGEG